MPFTSSPPMTKEAQANDSLTHVVPPSKAIDLPTKEAAEYYGYGDTTRDVVPTLNNLMSYRRRKVAFEGGTATEAPTKKRRFERRCSKTPAMLMQMQQTLMSFDFASLETVKESTSATCTSKSVVDKPSIDDSWDGGLEIAEELVMHLKKRHQRRGNVL